MFDRDALKSDSFSWKSALSLALASQLAYMRSDAGIAQVVVKIWGLDGCISFNVGSTQGYVAWDQDCAFVSYSGTESVGDWLLNASVHPTRRPYGRVHSGFHNGFDLVRDTLEGILDQAGVFGKRLWLTGHSLGGALAIINAAEWAGRNLVTGVYTFGQPKAVGAEAAAMLNQFYDGKLHRLVNDDDIIPGVPPGYQHVGSLYWFDERGELKSYGAATEVMKAEDLPNELSKEQFERLCLRLRELKDATDETLTRSQESAESDQLPPALESERQNAFNTSVEGIIPGVRDHNIERYIAQIRTQTRHQDIGPAEVDEIIAEAIRKVDANDPFRDELKLDTHAYLSHESDPFESIAGSALESNEYTNANSSAFSPHTTIPVLLRVNSPNWEPPTQSQLSIQSRLGNVVSAFAHVGDLKDLRDDPGVFSIKTSREGGILELTTSKDFINANSVHTPPITERGDGAIVGIIDTGVDVLHEAFLDGNGKTRILYLWDQKAAGNGPSKHDPAFDQSYGRLYDQNDIQKMIDQGHASDRLRDPAAHGTHVASIAAGRGTGNFAGGIAPDARLIVVIPDMKTEPGAPHSVGYSNSHVDALDFIKIAASKVGLPVAVNVSLGMNAGAHDGTSELEAAFDEFTGLGRLPGVVLVKSAGNERGHKGHASVAVPQNGYADITWNSATQSRKQDYIEVWFHAWDDIEFELISPSNTKSTAATAANPSVSVHLDGNLCRLTLTRNHKDNGANLLVIIIEPDGQPIQAGVWTLSMKGNAVLGPGAGVVHAWVERDDRRPVSFNTGNTDEMTLSIPGTANHVITVAACESALPLRLTNSSSWGLTRDNRDKPDIAAPGMDIVAALANTSHHNATVAQTGTSMAAPHVTGTVALVLSKQHKSGKPIPNAVQIRQVLLASAQNFNGVHNKGIGYGALDTLAFFNRF